MSIVSRCPSYISGLMAALILLSAPPVFAEDTPSVGNLFIEAYDKQDEAAMRDLIKNRGEEFPGEVKEMVEYAMSPNATPPEQDFLFNIALTISKMLEEETGDQRLFNAVKMNYTKLMEARQANALPKEAIEKTKKDLLDLGGGNWRINVFKLNRDGSLSIEIDVKENSGGEGLTPKVEFKTSLKAKDIVKKNLPKLNKGKIVWSSMGIGLKTVFLD